MSIIRAGFCTSALLAGFVLAGCSPGDIQFNGKVFDAINATGLVGTPSGQAKMAERQPLIVPPALDKLPAPGSAQPEDPSLAAIQDPDKAKVVSASERDRRQAEFCKANYDPAKARGDATADAITGPAGPCRPSAFTAFSKWNKGE